MLKPTLILFALGVAATGCHSPSGGLMAYSGGSQTYSSDERVQKTITMVDTRTGQPFFTIDIPPGKQLSFNFDKGQGDDPVKTPDLMRWEILDKGSKFGKLHNAQTVPNAASRRVDVSIRTGVAWAAEKPDRPLRTDEVAHRPDWWTPEGGPLPEDRRARLYDN